MADVFISYKKEDQLWAQRMNKLLIDNGFPTWWDTSIVPGESFSEIINEELKISKAVIVLWSKLSWNSKQVRDEALFAHHYDKLVSTRLDDIKIGIPFFGIQTTNIKNWNGSIDTSEALEILSGVERLIPKDVKANPDIKIIHGTGREYSFLSNDDNINKEKESNLSKINVNGNLENDKITTKDSKRKRYGISNRKSNVLKNIEDLKNKLKNMEKNNENVVKNVNNSLDKDKLIDLNNNKADKIIINNNLLNHDKVGSKQMKKVRRKKNIKDNIKELQNKLKDLEKRIIQWKKFKAVVQRLIVKK